MHIPVYFNYCNVVCVFLFSLGTDFYSFLMTSLFFSSVGSLHLISSSMNFLLILILNQLLILSLEMMIMKSLSALPLHYPKVHDYHMRAASVDVIAD